MTDRHQSDAVAGALAHRPHLVVEPMTKTVAVLLVCSTVVAGPNADSDLFLHFVAISIQLQHSFVVDQSIARLSQCSHVQIRSVPLFQVVLFGARQVRSYLSSVDIFSITTSRQACLRCSCAMAEDPDR